RDTVQFLRSPGAKSAGIVARGSAGHQHRLEKITQEEVGDETANENWRLEQLGFRGRPAALRGRTGPGPGDGKDWRDRGVLGPLRGLWRADPGWHENVSAAERRRLRRQKDRDRGEGYDRGGAGH